MGEISRLNGGNPRRLLNQHLIGRGPECALRLTENYVSTQHALIRWQGHAWELLDRGSRNGTHVNGVALEPGRPYVLSKGLVMSFGHPDETWLLSDAAEPEVMLVALDDGETLSGAHGLIGFPSSANPECTLYRAPDGTWKLEGPDGSVRPLTDGEAFESAGRTFRLSLPSVIAATASVGNDSGFDEPSLRFTVSSDEEFVELDVEYTSRRIPLGSRSHNYLLLTLARSYLTDLAAGLPVESSGWVDKEELAKGLNMTPEQIDGEVFRVRKHFARHGLKEAAVVIERRPRTKQIRIGLPKLRVERA
jgi:hypothetical protein